MPGADVVQALWAWTPYLGVGFLWNIAISLAAMAAGTVVGVALAVGRASGRPWLARPAVALTHLTRNVPTFVFMFYLAYLVPYEVQLFERVWTVPGWIKASLALSIAVVGFVSDAFLAALVAWRRGDHLAGYLFVPSWTMYFAIIVMASSTASVIGVAELVSRCNTVIMAVGDDAMMMWLYLYAMCWFFLFTLTVTQLMRGVRARLERRSLRTAT